MASEEHGVYDFGRSGNRFFVVRHGESEANVARLIISDPAAGTKAFGLTEPGKKQAQNVSICVSVCLCVCLSVCLCVCVSVSMSVYIYIYVCVYVCMFVSCVSAYCVPVFCLSVSSACLFVSFIGLRDSVALPRLPLVLPFLLSTGVSLIVVARDTQTHRRSHSNFLFLCVCFSRLLCN